jgi:hypothetical protein
MDADHDEVLIIKAIWPYKAYILSVVWCSVNQLNSVATFVRVSATSLTLKYKQWMMRSKTHKSIFALTNLCTQQNKQDYILNGKKITTMETK